MRKLISKIRFEKVMGLINCLAMVVVVQTANMACAWILGQPEEPEEVKKMRNF